MKYATRVNSFLCSGCTLEQALEQIGAIDGIELVDLNYPEHFKDHSAEEMEAMLTANGLKLNAVNIRFREHFLNGEFGNSNETVSQEAVELCKRGADWCNRLGGEQMIVWLGFDGFDYSFQIDYVRVLRKIVAAFQTICDYAKCRVSVEYKPYEERVHAFIDSIGMAALVMRDVDRENFGVTLDFCHMLMKKENPAMGAALLLDWGKLFGVHMNDGEGSTDDGLMVGMNNLWKTLEVFYYLKQYDYSGVIYFDTFPHREQAAAECQANVAMCRKVEALVEKAGTEQLRRVIAANDAVEVQKMFVSLLG